MIKTMFAVTISCRVPRQHHPQSSVECCPGLLQVHTRGACCSESYGKMSCRIVTSKTSNNPVSPSQVVSEVLPIGTPAVTVRQGHYPFVLQYLFVILYRTCQNIQYMKTEFSMCQSRLQLIREYRYHRSALFIIFGSLEESELFSRICEVIYY